MQIKMSMKYIFSICLLTAVLLFGFGNNNNSLNPLFLVKQDSLDKNNISAAIWNDGVFNQEIRTNNTPGFEWPKGSGKFAVFTTGFNIAGYVNNQLRMASAWYAGEYEPGFCVNGIFHTNNNFKIYKITRGDSRISNPDWDNWQFMVPYGAPFKDVNGNGIYEPSIDTPGVKNAAQTIFICLTDADPSSHSSSYGFGGGTTPMGAEVHFTAWCYDNPGYNDMQFFKWEVINKNSLSWDSTLYSIVSDPDLGDYTDDYIGSDSLRSLEYTYNSDNQDGDGTGRTYGANPPAIGMMFLNCNSPNARIVCCTYISKYQPVCEGEPQSPQMAYYYMKGFKNDGTQFVVPGTNPPRTSKFTFSGDPETQTGWTELTGRIDNCGGSLTGNLIAPFPPGDRRNLMTMKYLNQRMNPGDTQVVQIAQLIARGTNNLNSVTKLKQLADAAKQLCENNFIIGITSISTEIPKSFELSQNYPNPFNPVTKIRFEVPLTKGDLGGFVTLSVYNAIGQEITTLVNEQLKPGIYSIDWNAANYPSGIYFYNLKSGNFSETKKLVLLK